ncbi:MAG: hypothetical protein C4617_05060 [Candidatus Liberibacter europaeus]|uniref:Uncharacterized protein n=1 Tax=Candidatus Liberibacter europaeus TaxID=744859 RepID=A0A2T4VWJ2_9HYPH|nr:hypothetical protein [Candidatus Liberibacter europaeus]PTL86137.1 MAG: hypothetical protein C4617_05060 [Candidatus Liberibacter europaeus]
MTNNDLDFKIESSIIYMIESSLTHRDNYSRGERLQIYLTLKDGLSDDALRHIELEAKKAVKELLQPLMKTIRNIETKDLNKSSNPDDDVCESNGTSEPCPESN